MAYRDHLITTMDQLQSLYGERMGASVVKEIDHINDGYRKLIEVAPFVAVATSGPEGLDCSPKGDAPGFVRMSYATSMQNLQEGSRRLLEFVARHAPQTANASTI